MASLTDLLCVVLSVQNQKVDDGKAGVCKGLRSMVQDAHTALTDLRSRNAEQAFSQALVLLETSTPKVIIDLQTRNKTVA